ncbi:hypothetical protein HNP84_003624 [Thermocatellispora tengchongensis]|uniref:Uncharacterized protein n=1 Tax=Thermocatellispora tengchongensis TaxID=1073253 RepID=A0A840P2J0_9ACTN|nr:hypothetical protein [Thermocatellispora tengchongensis]MBB5133898.1 hypothetical protein [Thermocatellispora tengchongensis]
MSEMDVRGDSLGERALDEQTPTEIGIETSEADAVEQHIAIRDTTGPWLLERDLPLDVDPADAAEQNRTVELDEDDYR